VNIPQGTDINHYFEIMNTRGVQLEKYQILKAAFINNIHNNEKYSNDEKQKYAQLFGKIWDACSNMEKHVQYNFKTELREQIFGNCFDGFPKKMGDININETENRTSESISLKSILDTECENFNTNSESESENGSSDEKYTSIIDFPNFLLHVLRLHKKDEDISLDDKNLLTSFGYDTKTLPDSILFINDLLKYRTIFDRYFIKRDKGNDKWVILRNNLDYDEENDIGKKIVMIQSMFHVSYPSNSYKNWLYSSLKFFINKLDFTENDGVDFFNQLSNLSKDSYKKITDTDWQYKGTSIHHYIFNYLDYLLWMKYYVEIQGENKIKKENDYLWNRIEKNRKEFNEFQFTQRSSVEHIFPQDDIANINSTEENDITKENIMNSFGNLCLISKNSNSKYSDYNFNAKKEQFLKRKNTESLKQVIIFSYEKWEAAEILEHHNEIVNILDNSII
jgi:hypothetical protein